MGTDRIKVTMSIDNVGICPCMYQTGIAPKVKLDPINMSREKIFIFIDFIKLTTLFCTIQAFSHPWVDVNCNIAGVLEAPAPQKANIKI